MLRSSNKTGGLPPEDRPNLNWPSLRHHHRTRNAPSRLWGVYPNFPARTAGSRLAVCPSIL